MNVLLNVENLKKHYKMNKRIIRAVDGVSFSVGTGETFALVGESGCGKTTVARTILRLEEATEGKVYFEGKEILCLHRKSFSKVRCHMQIVFQSPFGSLDPRQKLKDIVSEPLIINSPMSKSERMDKVKELIALVGLSEDQMSRYPHEFSGGQRQRIGIARALALNPKFLVLDEPTSALDVSIQSQILNLLKDLQAKLGLSYLFISHNLSIVNHFSDRVGVMYLGKLFETATARTIFRDPVHPYTQSLFSATPDISQKRMSSRILLLGDVESSGSIPGGCRFHRRCPRKKGAICEEIEPQLREIEENHFVGCHWQN